jgi:hypothetical protein
MDFIFHILGLCPDHHNHFNFILFLSEFMSGNFCWCTIKNYLKTNYGLYRSNRKIFNSKMED